MSISQTRFTFQTRCTSSEYTLHLSKQITFSESKNVNLNDFDTVPYAYYTIRWPFLYQLLYVYCIFANRPGHIHLYQFHCPQKRICYFMKYGTRIGHGWIRIRLYNVEKSPKAIFAWIKTIDYRRDNSWKILYAMWFRCLNMSLRKNKLAYVDGKYTLIRSEIQHRTPGTNPLQI